MEKLALLSGQAIRDIEYPAYKAIDNDGISKVNGVLNSGLLSGFVARGNEHFLGGPIVRELESTLTEIFKVKYAVTVNSATSALHASLVAAGIGPGDEVIVPPVTMSATASAVLMCKAMPIFADIEENTYCISTADVRKKITSKTKAIIAVNLFGLPADLQGLKELAREKELKLIEDNAQAPGACYQEDFTGTIGDMGVLSFNHHKVMNCGEGGAVLTNDPRLARRLQLTRNHGEVVIDDWGELDDADIVGYNYRLTELQAALMVSQVKKLNNLNDERIKLADRLTEKLQRFDFLQAVTKRPNSTHVYYLYPIRFKSELLNISRSTLLSALVAEGVHASAYVKPIHHLPIFQKYNNPSVPGFKQIFPSYEDEMQEYQRLCPVAEVLSYHELFVTNICRPPNTFDEIDEFVYALEKIEANIADLREWEMNEVNSK